MGRGGHSVYSSSRRGLLEEAGYMIFSCLRPEALVRSPREVKLPIPRSLLVSIFALQTLSNYDNMTI